MLKIYNTDLNTNEFRKLNDFEIGCWVHLEKPTEEELQKVSSSLGVKKDFLVSILDDDEKPRIDEEDGTKMLLLDVPVKDSSKGLHETKTLPLAILIVRNDYIVTVALQKYEFLEEFSSGKVKEFYTYKKSRFVIQIIYRLAVLYLKTLRDIDKKIETAESKILTATKNEELVNLLALENSLTYIITALQSNGVVLDKIKKVM